MSIPISYTDVPADFTTWLATERENAMMGRTVSNKLCAYLPDIHNLVNISDPEVLANTAPLLLRAFTNKDVDLPMDFELPPYTQSPSANKAKGSGSIATGVKKDIVPSHLSYQLDLTCTEKFIRQEAAYYRLNTIDGNDKAMRITVFSALLFAFSRSLIDHPTTKSLSNLQPTIELAYRAVLATHIPPIACLSISLQQFMTLASFIESLCVALEKALPLIWHIAKEYTDAHMQQRARNKNVTKVLSEGMRHEITSVLSCISACLKIFLGHYNELYLFLTNKGNGSSGVDLYPTKHGVAIIEKMKGKTDTPQDFDESRFKLSETYRSMFRKIIRTYIYLSDVITNVLEPIFGLFSVHGIIIPKNLCENILTLHANYEQLFSYIIDMSTFLRQGFDYLEEYVSNKDQLPPDYLAYCEFLMNVRRKPSSVEAVNMASSTMYTTLTKDYLCLCQSFNNASRLAGLCCTVLFFAGSMPISLSEDDKTAQLQCSGALNTAKVIENPIAYSFTEQLLISALTSLHRLSRIQKLPSVDDRAAILSFCQLPLLLVILGHNTRELFPHFFLLREQLALQTERLGRFIVTFIRIYKQAIQCVSLVSGRPIYRYDTRGDILTYHPDVSFAIQAIVVNAIILDSLLSTEKPEKGGDKQSFLSGYNSTKTLFSALPIIQPLTEVSALQVSCYLAVGSFLNILSKHVPDKNRIYPLCYVLFTELNTQILGLPTTALLLEELTQDAAEHPSSAVNTRADKRAITDSPKLTISNAINALNAFFPPTFPLTFTFLYDALHLGAIIIYSITLDSTYPKELYSSGSIGSVFSIVENLYLILTSKSINSENSNESIDLLSTIAKTYLEYARFSILIFPYESQHLLPKRMKLQELVENIYVSVYETVRSLISDYVDKKIDVYRYNRYIADIILGFVGLSKRAMRLTDIKISDQLFALYNLFDSSSKPSLTQTIKSIDVASADKKLLLATRDILAENTAHAGQKLLLTQVESTQLPLYVDDLALQANSTIKLHAMGAEFPPSTMIQPVQWMQALISLCIETLMLHTRYDKCALVFQANMSLISSSYELALYNLVQLTITGEYKTGLQAFVNSLSLSDKSMFNLLFKSIRILLFLPKLYSMEYLTLSEHILFLLETASQRLASVPDLHMREEISLTFSAIKYSSLVQLGLYSEKEHDEQLLELIAKMLQRIPNVDKAPINAQTTSRPGSRSESVTKGTQKQIKVSGQQPALEQPPKLSVDEVLVSFLLTYLIRRPILDTISENDISAFHNYQRLMLILSPSDIATLAQAHTPTDLTSYTEQWLLSILGDLSRRIVTFTSLDSFFQSISAALTMFGPSHADTCILLLCDYIERIVLQQHSLSNPTSQEENRCYIFIVIAYATLLIFTIQGYFSSITWVSFSSFILTMQLIIAWLRDYGASQLWSLLAAQLDAFILNGNVFLYFDTFAKNTSKWGHGITIVRIIQSRILKYAINTVLWGSINVSQYILMETSVGSEELNYSLFEHALHRLYVSKSSLDEGGANLSIRPLPEDISSYITSCYAPRLLLEGIPAFFTGHMDVAQNVLATLDTLFVNQTSTLAFTYMSDKISKELVERSRNHESPLNNYLSYSPVSATSKLDRCMHLEAPLLDIYIRFSTAVKLVARSDTTFWQEYLYCLSSALHHFRGKKEEFTYNHLATIRSLEPCSPLREKDVFEQEHMTLLSDYSTVGIRNQFIDLLLIQKITTLQSTILECCYACRAANLYGDLSYWHKSNLAKSPTQNSDDMIHQNKEKWAQVSLPSDVLEAGLFVDYLSKHILLASALGTSFSLLFSDEMRYFLLFTGSHRILPPDSLSVSAYYDTLLEGIDFIETILSSLSTHQIEQLRALRLCYSIIVVLMSAPQFSLSDLLLLNSFDRVKVSLFGMIGKRFELAVLILSKVTASSIIFEDVRHATSPIYRQLELLKAVALERLAFIVDTRPEQIQDIIFGSDLITNPTIARWLTETTSTFIFNPASMSLLEYCKKPTSFCIHSLNLLFASNKALLSSGFCHIDLGDLKLDTINEYVSSPPEFQDFVSKDLLTALNNANNFTIQFLRLLLTRGPFKYISACVLPSVDYIVTSYMPNVPSFTSTLPALFANLTNPDKKASNSGDKKAEGAAQNPYVIHSFPQALFALATLTSLYRQGFLEFLRVSVKTGICPLNWLNIKEFVLSRYQDSNESTNPIELTIVYPDSSDTEFLVRFISGVLLDSTDFLAPINGKNESITNQFRILESLALADTSIPDEVKHLVDKLSLQQEQPSVGLSVERGNAVPPKKSQNTSSSASTCQPLDDILNTTEFRLMELFYSSLQTLLFLSAAYSHTSLTYEAIEHLLYNRATKAITSPSLFDVNLCLMRTTLLEDIQMRMFAQLAHFQARESIGSKNMLAQILWYSGAIITQSILLGSHTSPPILLAVPSQTSTSYPLTLMGSHYNELTVTRNSYSFNQRRPGTASTSGSSKDVRGKTTTPPPNLAPTGSLTIEPDFLTISPEKTHIFNALFNVSLDIIITLLDKHCLKMQQSFCAVIDSSLSGLSAKCTEIITNATSREGLYLQLVSMLKYGLLCSIHKNTTAVRPITTIDGSFFQTGLAKIALRYSNWHANTQKLMTSYWNYVPASLISELHSVIAEISNNQECLRSVPLVGDILKYKKAIHKGVSQLYYKSRSFSSRASSALGQSEALSNAKGIRPVSSANSRHSDFSLRTMTSAKLVSIDDLAEFVPPSLQKANDLLSELLRPLCEDIQKALPEEISGYHNKDDISIENSTNARNYLLTFVPFDFFTCCLPYTIILNSLFAHIKQIHIIYPRMRERSVQLDLELFTPEFHKGRACIDVHNDVHFAHANNMNLGFKEIIPYIQQIFNSNYVPSKSKDEIMRYLNEDKLAFICSFVAPKQLVDPLLIAARPDRFNRIEKMAILHSEFEFSYMRTQREVQCSPSTAFITSSDGVRLSLLSSNHRILVMNELPLPPAIVTCLTVLYFFDYLRQKIDLERKKTRPPSQQEKKPQGAKKPVQGAQEPQFEIESVSLAEKCSVLLKGKREMLLFNSIATYVAY